MLVSFQLTMPNNNAWNGKWTGAGKEYFVVKNLSNIESLNVFPTAPEFASNFYYNFGDGWGANVKCEKIDSKEAIKRRKRSAGFCGYEWMIESIITNGKILSD